MSTIPTQDVTEIPLRRRSDRHSPRPRPDCRQDEAEDEDDDGRHGEARGPRGHGDRGSKENPLPRT